MDLTSKVKLIDLVDALEWVSADGAFDNAARVFKDLLDRSGMLQAWYDYEEEAVEGALLEWAASEGLQVDKQ